MIRVIAGAGNADRARKVAEDLSKAGLSAEVSAPQKGDVVVAVLGKSDMSPLSPDIITALDKSLHIVVVRTEAFDLPKMISHLTVIDLKAPDALKQIQAQLALLDSPDAPLAMKVLTPNTRRSNRRTGIYMTVLVILLFVGGLYGVIVLHWQAPAEEYEAVDTAAAMTISFYVGPELQYFSTYLPRSAEDESHFPATLAQLPTAYRPLMGMTMTAYAQGTPMPTIAPTQDEQ